MRGFLFHSASVIPQYCHFDVRRNHTRESTKQIANLYRNTSVISPYVEMTNFFIMLPAQQKNTFSSMKISIFHKKNLPSGGLYRGADLNCRPSGYESDALTS